MDYKRIFEEEFSIKDIDAFEKYIELVSKDYSGNEYSERHHILPRSLFPEYKSNDKNIVNLKFIDHVKAHELLFKFTENSSMFNAFILMSGRTYSMNILLEMGYTNISQLPDIRDKISKSKIGKIRTDLLGGRYFGASEDKILKGLKSMREKLKDTAIVRDEDCNKFRISIFDERYKSGEYIPFNKGISSPNNSMKNRDNVDKFLNSRKNGDKLKSSWSKDELLNYLLDNHKNGKKVLGKVYFSSNYARIVNLTSFERIDIHKEFVQRLSKG